MATPPPHLLTGNETIEICITLPPKINSIGIWENMASPSVFLTYSLPLLELQMLLIFVVTQLVLAVFKPLGITIFASQMFAGIIMGPSMMGKLVAFKDIFINKELGLELIDTAAMFGFAIFSFMMAVKVDVKIVFKASRTAKLVGIVSIVSPFVVGLAVYQTLRKSNIQSNQISVERLMVNSIQSSTCFSVIASLLSELRIINSELGRLALSSAIVNDFCSFLLVYSIDLFRRWSISPSLAIQLLGITIPFIIVLFCVCRPLMFWIIRRTPEGRPIKEVYIIVIMMGALGSSVFTHWFIESPLFGAFLFGLAVPDGPPLGSTLVQKFELFANGVFLSAYVTTVTMSVDPEKMLSDPSRLQFSLIFVLLTFFAKFISSFVASFWSMLPFRDSLAFALIMSSKGIIEFSYFTSFRDVKVITEATYSVLAFSILVNATLIPILLKFLYDPNSRKYAGYQKRNLMHLNNDAELRILACIHRPENVPTLINLLDLICPTKESPILIYALHLIELMGRDSPIFIAHQKQEDGVVSSFEHSLAFNQYEQKNWGLVTVNTFTAISPPIMMNEDINVMALDKQTSFLILPFHRKLSMDGSIDFENNVIRNLNSTILDQSPCSVGILVDRGVLYRRRESLKLSLSSSSYSICMLFLGGKDDREALTLAKRMAHDPRVKLTVIHLIADEDCRNAINWDTMLDAEMLKDIKKNQNDCGILYVEEVSNNGPEAARIIRSIADDYDLIIVGRRNGVVSVQTSGLSEWSEFPELGVVGDLLASTDLNSRVSVLVVQQQHYIDVA